MKSKRKETQPRCKIYKTPLLPHNVRQFAIHPAYADLMFIFWGVEECKRVLSFFDERIPITECANRAGVNAADMVVFLVELGILKPLSKQGLLCKIKYSVSAKKMHIKTSEWEYSFSDYFVELNRNMRNGRVRFYPPEDAYLRIL